MSMDRSLKLSGGLVRQRSVLSRDERIAQMMEEGKFDPAKDSPMGLPKLRIRHSKAGTKSKKAAEEVPAEGAAAPAEGAAPAEAAKETKAGKPAAKEARAPAAKEAKPAAKDARPGKGGKG